MGAISAREAADARARAAARMAPGGAQGRNFNPNAYTGNIAAQGNNIMMMAFAGQNPAMLAIQQGTQLSQVLNDVQRQGGGLFKTLSAGFRSMVNPTSLLTLAFVGLGAAGIQALMALRGESESFDDALEKLTSSAGSYKSAITLARATTAELRAEFGQAGIAARDLAQAMADIERRAAERAARSVVKKFGDDQGLWLPDLAWRDSNPGASNDAERFDNQRAHDRGRLVRLFEVDRATPEVDAALDAMTRLQSANGLDAQIAAAEELLNLFTELSERSGEISEKEDGVLGPLTTALAEFRRLKAQDDNFAGEGQIEQLITAQGQRIALADQALRTGEDSAEVRALELRQAREAIGLELERAGIEKTSALGLIALSRGEYEVRQKHQAADKARQDAFDQYIRSQDDQIAGLEREGQLLGASTAERIRANALAEAEIEIRDRGREKALSAEDQALIRARARARAEAEIANERERALRAIRQEALADQFDTRIALTRDPVSQAQIEFQREYQARMAQGADMAVAYASAMRAYNGTVADAVTGGRVQIATIMDEMAAREAVSRQVAAGLIPAGEADALMRQELELRPLIAAAARAEGEEKRQLTEVVQGLRLAYALQAEARRQQQAADYLRSQGETLRNLQLELALLGQSEATRGRVLAMAEAERQIRAAGIDSQGALAGQMRENARMIEAQTRALQAQAKAWGDIRSAAESAIDGTVDALLKGDIPGALSGIVTEITGIFADLAIKNPLKNAILGTDYATMDSLGGWRGILGRLLGNDPVNEGALIDQGSRPVQSMMITAGSVTIQAGGIDLGGMAANLVGAPGTGSLSGSAAVQKQIWDFFIGKGLAPHQVAGILGNVQAESSFNPLAQGDNGTSFGLFQHHNSRATGLLNYVGGLGNLTNVQAQLEYVWQELLTTEQAALERLKATGTPAEAAEAWMRGFEKPSDAAIATSGPQRAAAAEAAMAQLGRGATNAAAGLDVLGQGAGTAGDGLTRLLQGLLTGGKEGLGGSLLSIGLKVLTKGLGSFAVGGPTGGSNPARVAGLVHEEEFVFDAAATKRIGVENLEAIRRGRLRGYATGGWVSPVPVMPMAAANAGAAPSASQPAMNVHLSYDLRGAAGNRQIEDLVARGIKESWKEIARCELPGQVRKIVSDPRRVG